MANISQKDILSSVVSNIRTYTGNDPLRPWIQGIRKLHQSLPSSVLKEKLPRFLQKCAQTFEYDKRYQNDSRYLAVWIQLMDFVEDAKVLLKTMEKKQIGVKRAKFYIAYAIYYEKKKRFESAEKMYQLGVDNIVEPIGELQKSYAQFVDRMKHRKARSKLKRDNTVTTSAGYSSQETSVLKDHKHAEIHTEVNACIEEKRFSQSFTPLDPTVDAAEPTNVVSNMAEIPQNSETIIGSPTSFEHPSSISNLRDEELTEPGFDDHSIADARNSGSSMKTGNTEIQNPFICAFKILPDGDDDDDDEDCDDNNDDFDDEDDIEEQTCETRTKIHDCRLNEDTVIRRLKEDTVIRKFVGSTVYEEPKVENACHHGLVDPTINLRQAMDDINGMFGKPLNFVKARKSKKQETQFHLKPNSSNQGFFILADDEQDSKSKVPACSSNGSNGEGGFFEPTIFTKEAMDEINDLFGKPLDF